MKKITIFLVYMALSYNLLAQPTAITWQGKLLDNSGNAITQNNVAMTFAMFDASTGGNQLWPASGVVTKTVDVVNGLYSVQLGTGTGDDIAFTATMFDGKTPWLEVKVGTETLPRTEITNVPFALISNDLSAAAWETPGEIGKTTPNTGKFTSVETGSMKLTDGASDGKVLTSDASGNASWQNTSLANFEESSYTYDSKTGVKLKAANAEENVDLVLSPKGNGAIMAHQPDGTETGGNNRGQYAVDFQMVRDDPSQVASGTGSAAFGSYNTVSGAYSYALGYRNTVSGKTSFAVGDNNIASGSFSTAIGSVNTASNLFSLSYGGSNSATGMGSFAFGSHNQASGALSLAFGYQCISTDDISFSLGENANASKKYAVAIGKSATASNQNSVAIGNNPIASGYSSLATGDHTTASGYISTAMGNRTIAPSAFETVVGRYNSDYTPSSTTDWIATDRLFVVGNGATDVTKSNALTILKNANTTIGGSLTINGNGTNASISFPTGRGTSGQVLTSDGSGGTSWATPSVSQWITSGSNIYYNTGNVGIGNVTPHAPLEFANVAANRKIVFYTTADNDHQFTGFGLNGDALRFQLGNTTGNFKFYGATSATTSNELFRIQGNGQVVIPALTTQGIIQNSATGVLSSTKGTANQVLKMNSDGTATEWGSETDPSLPAGTAPGQMQYWNGTAWVTVAAGTYGQMLEFRNSAPVWVDKNINTLSIGDTYQGGIIAYFLQSGDPGYDANVRHGLIATPTDQSSGASWGCMGDNVGIANVVLGAGPENTLSIVTNCSEPGIAARLCYDLVLNGYSDWFLPSGNELVKLYQNKSAIGGLENTFYWSSTKVTADYAIAINFTDGSAPFGIEKSSLRRVRAVRAF